jgi:hypothetical protein
MVRLEPRARVRHRLTPACHAWVPIARGAVMPNRLAL